MPLLVKSKHVPLRIKLLALAGAAFVVSPLNVFGDIPLLGLVDDAALLGLLLQWFVSSAERFEPVPARGM